MRLLLLPLLLIQGGGGGVGLPERVGRWWYSGKSPGVFGKVVGRWYLRKLAGSVLVVRVGYSNKCPESFVRGPSFAFGLAACGGSAALPAVL